MKRNVPLHEFMPYGAPDLLVAQRPHLSRALALSSTLAAGLWLAAAALAPLLAPPVLEAVRIPPRPYDVDRFEILPDLVRSRGSQVRPSPPDKGNFAPREEAQPIAPEGAIDYGSIAEQVQPGTGAGLGESVLPVATPVVDPDLPADVVEELPVAVTRVLPEYPDIARQAMVDGQVIVLVLVGRDGRVRDAKIDVNRRSPLLEEAALAAARQWVFSPALVNQRPVSVWTAIPFRFVLSP